MSTLPAAAGSYTIVTPGENIHDWATVANNNSTADAAIAWPEGQLLASINNAERSVMAAHAKFRNLTTGTITTTGAPNAQAFSSGHLFPDNIPPTGMRVLLKVGVGLTNTGPMTLNMDATGATVVKTQAGNDLSDQQVKAGAFAELIFDGTNWILITETKLMSEVLGTSNSILVSTTEANHSAAVDIALNELNIDANQFRIVITGLVTGTANTVLNAQVSTDGGLTYLSAAGSYAHAMQRIQAATPSSTITGNFSATQVPMTSASFQADDNLGASGEVRIYPPNAMQWKLQYLNHAQNNYLVFKGAAGKKGAATPAITHIRFFMTGSTGGPPPVAPTIHRGKFRLYVTRNNVVLRADKGQVNYSGVFANLVNNFPAVTWGSATAVAVTLSPNNLAATSTGTTSTNQGVRVSDAGGKTSGKVYFELEVTTAGNGAQRAFGIGTITSTYPAIGANATTGNTVVHSGGVIWANGVNTGSNIGAFITSNVIGIAVDLDNRKIWFRKTPVSNWNGSSTADPATNTGGVTIPAGTMVPFCTFGGTGGTAGVVCTANFGAVVGSFIGAVPSGFTGGWPA